jgi:hypothetical protein
MNEVSMTSLAASFTKPALSSSAINSRIFGGIWTIGPSVSDTKATQCVKQVRGVGTKANMNILALAY